MNTFMHIRSQRFQVSPGEDQEVVNEGMYGKAVAQYLQARLQGRGYEAPFICCEDWGWWVDLKGAPFSFGVAIYCGPQKGGLLDYFCTVGPPQPRMWNWRKFRFVETAPWKQKLHADLLAIFGGDPEIELVDPALDSPCSEDSDPSDPC
jgi:hypothetical protein